MSALDNLPNTSFVGIKFPAERITLHSTGRQHVHEYPKVPGGAPEKLGRGLWYITVRGSFQDRFPRYPDLYPTALSVLRTFYEKQITGEFIHPTVGKFNAFIASWRQDYDARLRSGEKVDLEFIEDQRSTFLAPPTDSANSTSVAFSQAQLDQSLAAAKSQLGMTQADLDIFDAIRATTNAVIAFSDQAQLYTQLLNAKALELVNLCQEADSLLSLDTPLGISVLDPLWDVWSAAVTIANIAQAKAAKMSKFTTPRVMTLNDVAMRLYKDISRASDLLSLNANKIPDPYRIGAGIDLLYFP